MAAKQKVAELSAGLLAVKGSAVPAQDMAPRAVEVPEPPAPEPEPELPLVEALAPEPEPLAPEPVPVELETVPEPAPAPVEPQAVAVPEPEGDRNDAPLNFRVSPAFRREFKTYAAQHDLKLNELLRLAFDVYKTKAS